MVVTSGGDITWTGSTASNTLSYSKDNGNTWISVNNEDTISVSEGDKVLWKGTPTPQQGNGIGNFSGDTNTRYSVEGNAMSLLYGDNFKGQISLGDKNYVFWNLFKNNTNVISAKNLSLPATTLSNGCYCCMFKYCTSLTIAPELPATILTEGCYSGMFTGCTNLNSITCLATDISVSYCTTDWVMDVAASGTFTKSADMGDWIGGRNGIPSSWNVVDV